MNLLKTSSTRQLKATNSMSSDPSSPTSPENEERPHEPRSYLDAWEQILSYVDVPELLAVRGVCRTLREAADMRLSSHVVFHGDKIKNGTNLVWTAHCNISLAKNPDLWDNVQVLDIVGECDCDAEWTLDTPCTCLESLGLILDHTVPFKLNLECIRVNMRNFRLGFPLLTSKVHAQQVIYDLDLYPTKPSLCCLPLAPICGSRNVAVNIRYDPECHHVPHTDFAAQYYDPHVSYSLQFLPATRPRLPEWYGVQSCGSRVYGYPEGHRAGRLAENLLGILAELATHKPGQAHFIFGRLQHWPGCWFSRDHRMVTDLVAYEGLPWNKLAPSVAAEIFKLKFDEAHNDCLESLSERAQEWRRAEQLIFAIPQLALEGPCVCGCFFVE
ncbi:hypothetical protein CcaverHIS002_0501440 [Cutaneotrichosporon cavernicola]|nr:hypothetical protein CcaverHIS002_0501440 [Cutaneotrichosporon cavernicola]